MEVDILNSEQQEIVQRTRAVLGDLREALATSNASDEDRAALAESIRQLDQLFLLVVAGEFNAGKSTFINTLVGQNLQDVGVTPTTSHVHLLSYGETVTETPVASGVWQHTAPVPLLRQVNIVDTPGTNAIVREHEALTEEFIPRSDLVLFVTSADRPFSESERGFLNRISEWGKKIVIVINKIDILDDDDRAQVIAFVKESADRLISGSQQVFAISAKKAQVGRDGDTAAWEASGFGELEAYITDTLDDEQRFGLKLANPLGVGQKLVGERLALIDGDLDSLKEDTQLLDDISNQMLVYGEDMQRNFQARLSEIDGLLFDMEKRGNEFFDETIRLGRIPDLMKKDKIQHSFEKVVVGETPRQIEQRVTELIDWMVEQDLRQWTSVADHLRSRRDAHADRIVGGAKEGTLAYDRQRLVDSIGKKTERAIATYNKEHEAAELAESAQQAVVNSGIVSISGIGLGAIIALATSAAWLDITGILAGLGAVAFGMFVLPNRRAKAKKELSTKLADLREKLVAALTEQFDKEMIRSQERINDTIAPFSRFVRAEQKKIGDRRSSFSALEAHIVGLKRQLHV